MVELKRAKGKLVSKLRGIPPVRLVVLSFAIMILLGTALLALPVAVRSGESSFFDAYFTATSACVTGSVLYDTYRHWTFFGQVVILVMIQFGSLGISTFATGLTLFARRRLGMREMLIAGENSGGGTFVDIPSLVKLMFGFTFACEALGAVILSFRFIPMFGLQGIWPSIFTSISAYCNAGFDVLGFIPGNNNLSAFAQDPLVNLTISVMIIIGGLGFVVVQDIYASKIRPVFGHKERKRLNVHSQICLRMSLLLLVLGTVVFFVFEYNGTMREFSTPGKLIASFMQSTSTRTAGFSSINIAEENEFSKVASIILMFIGASPGSTGGGVKVTTMALLWMTMVAVLRGREDVVMLRHKFSSSAIYKAVTIVFVALLIVSVDTAVIVWRNPQIRFLDALFESVSAFGTVGLSCNVTPQLDRFSQGLIALTMYIGRVGPVSLGLSIMLRQKKRREAVLPEGKMFIG